VTESNFLRQSQRVVNEYFLADRVDAPVMDALWAQGWRHFGPYFFRYSSTEHHGERFHVTPLRIDLKDFVLSRSQRRVLKTNRDVQLVIRDASIDASKEELFERHKRRFKDNVPESLHDFMSDEPSRRPCPNLEICVYRDGRLIAFSFLDIGLTATSAVYAAFEPEEHRRSLGILTMLAAIEHSRGLHCRYYYPGYAYREAGIYDYKKRFSALEVFDWHSGWKRALKL
jgi:arginine-tRNA-protein transferase